MKVLAVIFLALTPAWAVAAAPAFSGQVTGVSVTELLTIQAENGERLVRLYGIDAPAPGQPFSREALARVRELALGQTVQVLPRAADSAGVMVAEVSLADGTRLHERLLEEGLVWWDRNNAPEARTLRRLNAEALLAGAGIWSVSDPVPPWEYRQLHQLNRPHYVLDAEHPEAKAAEAAPEPAGERPQTPETPLKTFSVTPEMVEEAEQYDLMTLAMRHQPRVVLDAQGATVGLTVSNLAALPLATALGFQEGDVLTRVNGISLVSEVQILLLAAQFEDTKLFDVEVLRAGTPARWKIQIP